ncbi:MAG: hypothetical protein AAF653_18165, partial [Chloroflexota bacterium]
MKQQTANQPEPQTALQRVAAFYHSPSPVMQIVGWGLVNFFILTAAMLAAVQFRLSIGLGRPLGETYEPHFFTLYTVILVICVSTYVVSLVGRVIPFILEQLIIRRQFRQLIVATVISSIVVLLFLPGVSQLQMIYYVVMAMLLGAFLI